MPGSQVIFFQCFALLFHGVHFGCPGLLSSTQSERLKTATLVESVEWPLNPMQVSAGAKHAAILVEVYDETAAEAAIPERRLFTFGEGGHGRLGHGFDKELTEDEAFPKYSDEAVPRQVLALKNHRIVAVALGGAHCVALHESGTMYSWGVGVGGRLGHGHETEAR